MIRVVKPGMLTPIQDLGRSASGAADPPALRAASLIAANGENAVQPLERRLRA